MDKFPEIPTVEQLKATAVELKSKVPQTAQEYFDQVTSKVAKTKVVSDLVTDVKENPTKVGCEAGLSALAGAAVFAGLRFYDSYVAGKKEETAPDPVHEDGYGAVYGPLEEKGVAEEYEAEVW